MADGRIISGPLDQFGVIVDINRLGNPPGLLTKAQNATADPLGEKGSIRKRPGLKRFNGTAGSGAVKGGIGVPVGMGTSGPVIVNPFTDVSITLTQYTTPITPSGTQRLGTTFDDNSNFSEWDSTQDFAQTSASFAALIAFLRSQLDALVALIEAEVNIQNLLNLIAQRRALEAQLNVLTLGTGDLPENLSDIDFYDVEGYGTPFLLLGATEQGIGNGGLIGVVSSLGNTNSPQLVVPTLIGDTSGHWYSSFDSGLATHIDSGTVYTNTKTKIFPTGKVKTGLSGFSVAGGGVSETLGALHATAVLNNVLYYVDGNYTVGSNPPPIRAFDGLTDRVAFTIPKSSDVSSTVEATQAVCLLAANGVIYICSQDGGTVSANTGIGSVWVFDPNTRRIQKLGTTFAADDIPCCLAWAYGRLFVGTASNNASGHVYWIRPGIDTAFTLDLTLAAGEGIVNNMAVFQGQVYAAIQNRTLAATNLKLKVRNTLGVWSDADTGNNDTNAGHLSARGYLDVIVWPPENSGLASPVPTLFAVRIGSADDAVSTCAIRRLNAGAWSTVYNTGSSFSQFISSYVISALSWIPVLWCSESRIIGSTNGTSWTDLTAQLTLLTGVFFVMPPVLEQV